MAWNEIMPILRTLDTAYKNQKNYFAWEENISLAAFRDLSSLSLSPGTPPVGYPRPFLP